MFTRHNVLLVIIAALAAVIGIVGVAHGAPASDGHALAEGCKVTVIINTGRGYPDAAIDTIEANGGLVVVAEQTSTSITLTVTGWTLYEDGDWGDLRYYEVECAIPTRTPVVLYIAGEAGDPEYDAYAATYGKAHGCHTLAVIDDVNNPISPYIHSVDLCQLSQADVDNAVEELGDLLLGMGQAAFIPIIAN